MDKIVSKKDNDHNDDHSNNNGDVYGDGACDACDDDACDDDACDVYDDDD